jgi:hypothetical protein
MSRIPVPSFLFCWASALEEVGTAKNRAEAINSLRDEISKLVAPDCNRPLLDGLRPRLLLNDQPSIHYALVFQFFGNQNAWADWTQVRRAEGLRVMNEITGQFVGVIGYLTERNKREENPGIWELGLNRTSPLYEEGITIQPPLVQDYRFLEITVRNAVTLGHYPDLLRQTFWNDRAGGIRIPPSHESIYRFRRELRSLRKLSSS